MVFFYLNTRNHAFLVNSVYQNSFQINQQNSRSNRAYIILVTAKYTNDLIKAGVVELFE